MILILSLCLSRFACTAIREALVRRCADCGAESARGWPGGAEGYDPVDWLRHGK